MTKQAEHPFSVVEKLPPTEVSSSVITVLQELIEEAKRGEVLGVAVVMYDRARNFDSTVIPGENPSLLLGGLCRVQHRLLKAIE